MPDHLKEVKLSFPSPKKTEALNPPANQGLNKAFFLPETTPVSFRAEVLGFRANPPQGRTAANE
ncbi:MAG: hypothetical protein CMO61_01640 [Verrucomicrobiales bacterium]|jgi:hypothetical protein|nr:hypothetical protein [Verrucomicrobiales bacterium]|tara:strand:- start:6542 stop:6733 length:192 start_codon:yes stop_codon:yes gene_type:complete